MFTSNPQMEAFVRDMTPEMLKAFIEAIMKRMKEDASISAYLGYDLGKVFKGNTSGGYIESIFKSPYERIAKIKPYEVKE